jgi:hypothetical protein
MCRSAYVVDVVDVAMPVGGHASCQNARAVPRGGDTPRRGQRRAGGARQGQAASEAGARRSWHLPQEAFKLGNCQE